MAEQLKILVSGDVRGNFKKLFSKVENIDKKSGPFDYLICVGNFFGETDEEFLSYKNGQAYAPIPTYVLGPNDEKSLEFYSELNGCELAPNITYLGKRGVFTTTSGLIIAYVSGVEDPNINPACQISEDDLNRVRNACIKGQSSSYRGIDILLSSSWPAGITKYVDTAVSELPKGSIFISKLAYAVKPRYHFFGLAGKYYERNPYKNIRSEFGCHVTRAMALADVGNNRKDKWIYAMNVVPMKYMKDSALNMMTTDTTECPYEFEESENNQQFFYDMNYKHNERRHKRKGRYDDSQSRISKVMNISQDECWFCLASPKFEKHLVISVGEEAYLTLPKGGLVWDHAMILPVSHYKDYSNMPASLKEEINQFKKALTKLYATQKKIPVFFDRSFKTPHFQIQAVPIPFKNIEHVRQLFMTFAEQRNFSLTEIPESTTFEDISGMQGDYFYVEIDSYRYIHTISNYFPLQFAREVLARREILNVEKRVDWRKIETSREEEIEIAEKFREAYKPFDFTI